MGKIATVGLASVIFGTMMNVTGSSLASWWHNRTPEDEAPEKPDALTNQEVINHFK